MSETKKMRALVLRGKGYENLAVEEVPIPQPGPDQMLARVDCAGICTSLLKIISQGADHPMMYGWDLASNPAILGDEGSITLVEVGKNLRERFKTGERFAMQPSINHPPIFRRDKYPNNAEGVAKTGAGYTLPGHLAEYILIAEDNIAAESMIRVDDGSIPYAHAAIAEPLSCCISAQEHHFHLETPELTERRIVQRGVKPGGVLVIIGAGMMGRMNLDIALSSMPRVVIVSDYLPERLDIVNRLFSRRAKENNIQLVTTNPTDLEATVKRLTNNAGADDVIVAVGKKQAVESAPPLLARGGVLDFFGGLSKADDFVSLPSSMIHYDEVAVVGSSGGIPWDIQRAVDLISERRISPELHITRVCSLEDVPQVLQMMQANQLDGKAITYPALKLPSQIAKQTWTAEDELKLLRDI